MNRICILSLALVFMASVDVFSQEPTLQTAVQDPVVTQELQEPDGVSIETTADGGWRVFARGSAEYDFNDAGEIQTATEEATLNAKANLAKFLKERIMTTEVQDKLS